MTDKKSDSEKSAASEAVDQDIDEHEGAATDGSKKDASNEEASKNDAEPTIADDEPKAERRRLQASISVRTLLVAGLIAALVAGIGVMMWLYFGAKSELDEQAREAADTKRAEQIALDYATNAAAMNFKDIPAWKAKLVAGTSPELKERLGAAADQMEQILVPLQWDSTARPLSAKVRSKVGGAYIVDAFVSVMTKTAQGPDPLQSTATYSVTIDSDKDWQITDVGGIGAAVEGR
jgi:Mce-associated membrane protein